MQALANLNGFAKQYLWSRAAGVGFDFVVLLLLVSRGRFCAAAVTHTAGFRLV